MKLWSLPMQAPQPLLVWQFSSTFLVWCCLFIIGGILSDERETAQAIAAGPTTETANIEEPPLDTGDLEYWAYQRVQRPEVPALAEDDWSRTSLDRFVLAKLREKGLQPHQAAAPLAWLRRVTFTLTGLPPTLDELLEFLHDSSDDARSQVVERLLASPAYGEHWAQQWLDLVRFAETDGFEHDHVRPEAWRYRDWVIQAFNDDLPYDEFLRLQLAGDELYPDSPAALIATGYLLAGPDMPDINSQIERRHEFLNGMTANVGEVLLGLRFGCAQCHHHRSDPITQHDFYRLRSYFETIDLFKSHTLPGETAIKEARVVRNQTKSIPASHLWIRGDFRRPGPEIEPEVPRVLAVALPGSAVPAGQAHGRRTALADWLTDRGNPLTARVIVNRVWQAHFGKGLISTPSDFGWMGDSATHPELLDWLAVEFMESGWSFKQLHRLILNSASSRLASFPGEESIAEDRTHWQQQAERDPSNRYLSRMPRRRLTAESIRDSLLACSGRLNSQAFGPGVRPPLPAAVASTLLRNQWPVTEDTSEHTRRSIYLFARRNLRLPLLEAFDKPDTNLSCPTRSQTTIAPQALHLLNSEFVRECATALAQRLEDDMQKLDSQTLSELFGIKLAGAEAAAPDTTIRITLLYLHTLGRGPTAAELQTGGDWLGEKPVPQDWINLCHAVLNLNEFIYLD